MGPRRLLLWDIDGTLLQGGGVGSRVLLGAAAAVVGVPELPMVDMHGKTDPQIIRDAFVAAEIAADLIDELIPEAMTAAEVALAAAEEELRARSTVLPGVVEVLQRLDGIDGVRQTVLTGNLVRNSALKLAAFDLARFIDEEIGAYGTDNENRLELVPIALERSARLRRETYDGDDVWVIGDTALDLACARAGGVRCLLVGTGTPGWDGVKDLGADAVLPDLADVDEVVRLLTS